MGANKNALSWKKKGVCKYKGDRIWSCDRCLAETKGVASREIAALLSLPLRKMSKFQERLSNLLVVFLTGLVWCQNSAIPLSVISSFQSQCFEMSCCWL